MPLAPPLSSREVRRAASNAVDAVQSLGNVVNANAHRLNDVNHTLSDLRVAVDRMAGVPRVDSTFWQRLRWLVRGV
jgi:hypothetical protein